MKIAPQSVALVNSMGDDLSVVNAARVSFAKESDWEERTISMPDDHDFAYKELSEKDAKLINYLAKHNHWTPFGHVFLSFRIKAPIFVARQLVKHQVGLVWNEVSRRYVDEEPEFYFPTLWRGAPVNAKQGSTGEVNSEQPSFDINVWTRSVVGNSLDCYTSLLEANVAPEQARMILPLNTMTEWIWSGSLAAFSRVCNLRLDPHTQQETQEIAQMINKLIPEEMQHSWNALTTKE